jgi:hypothetical protein
VKTRQFCSPGYGPDGNWVDESSPPASASLVTPQTYQNKQITCEMIHQQERVEKSEDTVLMRDDDTLDTSSPSDEVKVKNINVQEVEKWIAGLVKETIFGCCINFYALEKPVEKAMAERVPSWNWEIDLEESCSGINKKNVAVETKTKASGTVCVAALQEIVGKDIVNVVGFKERKATVMETSLEKQANGTGSDSEGGEITIGR